MKRLLFCCLAGIMAWAAQAQNTMVVHLRSGATKQIETEKIDSMTWEGGTLHIYMNDKTTVDYAVGQVENLSWLVTSTPEPPITNGDVSLGSGEAFYISDEMTHIRADKCSMRFSPTVVTDATKLVVRSATSAPPVKIEGTDPDELVGISENAVCIDADLDGIHELDGFVEIRIPLNVSSGSVPGVAYYNETTKEWEPIDYDYDTRTHEAVIWTNHLSTYEAYEIKDEHTRNARLNFFTIPYTTTDTPIEEIAHMIENGLSATVDWTDFASTWWGNFSSFGLDMTYNAFKSSGLEMTFFEKHNERIGKIGTMFACYDILRAGLSGDNQTAGMNTMKLMLSKITGALTNALESSVMTAAMCSVAILDYALNQMWETSWSDRQDLYRRCYEAYYSSNSINGLPHHNIRAREWYQILLPEFEKGSPTIEGVHQAVEQIVDDYVWEFWNLPFDDQILYWEAIGGPNFSYSGGLSEALKKELADNKKAEITKDILPVVFEAIGREMKHRNYTILYDHMKDYAKMMNQVIRFDFVDGAATTASQLDGCTVRFKDLPSTILDPQKWQVKLNSLGKGTLRFRLYPYVVEGVQPLLEVVDKDGTVLKEIPIVIAEGTTTIELGDGEQKGFNYKEATQLSTVNDPDGAQYKIFVETLDTEWDPFFYIDYNVWLYPLDTDMPSLFATSPAFNINGANIGLNSPGLNLEGTFTDPLNKKLGGTGTFSLTIDHFVTVKTREQYEQWWRTDAATHLLDLANIMLNGNVKRDITGTFTFEWSDEVNNYVFHFNGSGTYSVEGERVSHLANVDTMDGFAPYMNYENLEVVGTDIFSLNGTTTIDYIITYELKE